MDPSIVIKGVGMTGHCRAGAQEILLFHLIGEVCNKGIKLAFSLKWVPHCAVPLSRVSALWDRSHCNYAIVIV